MAVTDAGSHRLSAGAAALERGAWDEALTAFERAVAAGAGLEALEGVASAASFLDRVQSVFEARERASCLQGGSS